ncbi:hypothetical protein Tco_0023470, partial [Tanacetum coccineum]
LLKAQVGGARVELISVAKKVPPCHEGDASNLSPEEVIIISVKNFVHEAPLMS